MDLPSDIESWYELPKEMTDEERRSKFEKELEEKGWSRKVAGDDWEPALDALVKADRLDLGILVTGAFGCGKTSLLRAATSVQIVNLGCRDSLEWIDPDGEECGLRYYALLNRGVVLDDLGAECPRNDYGVKRDMVGEYIVAHYAKGCGRLYITTNLTAAEIANRYGGRVADRLKELCVPLAFKGRSKRQWPT